MVRVGFAGIGFIAEEYIKLITSGKITGCTVCAMSSRNMQRMEDVKAKYNLAQAVLFSDYNEMLKSGTIDAVVICTPHHFHIQMAEAALQHGLHTLIEKPIGVFADEAQRLTQTVADHPELVTGVLFCRRASKAFRELHRIVSSNELGQIRHVNWLLTDQYRTPAYFRSKDWRGSWSGEGGGLLLNQVSHHLDLVAWLFGVPERMQAFCGFGIDRDIEVENEATLQMWYPNHVSAQFIASLREFPGTNRLEISGSKGQVILENDRHMVYRKLAVDERDYASTTEMGFGSIPYEETVMDFDDSDLTVMQAAIVNNFIQTICGNETILCPVEEAAQSLNIINGAYISSWLQAPVTYPLDTAPYRKFWENPPQSL